MLARMGETCVYYSVLCALHARVYLLLLIVCLHMHLMNALSHHKQEAGCIYINNAGPWNAIMHLGYRCIGNGFI